MEKVKLKIYSENGNIPTYATLNSVGADIQSVEDFTLHPGSNHVIKTGLFVEIPDGYELQVRPRSGLAAKYGITITNSPGTIDADYRGEIGVILHNLGKEPFQVKIGDRIAQLVLKEALQADFIQVYDYKDLEESDRGKGGFGSTGVNK